MTSNPTAEWIAGQVTEAFPWDQAPRHLIRDRDGAFGASGKTPQVFRGSWETPEFEMLLRNAIGWGTGARP